jgi:2-keto-4-pentenoate hydratase
MEALLASRERDLDAGASPLGWKIGINVEAVQQQLGLTAPVVGYLTSAGLVEDGSRVPVARWTNPMLEPEVAIRVGDEGEVAGLAPAIELVDIDIPLDDLEQILFRNVFHRGVAIGPQSPGPASATVGCEVTRDGETMASADAPFDAEATVAHVRGFLCEHGAELQPGDWIIAGSLTAPVALTGSGRFEVAIEGLGRVSVAIDA